MKSYFLLFAFTLSFLWTNAQDERLSIILEDLDGVEVNFEEIAANGKSKVLIFWATYCAGCKEELKAVSKISENWKADYNTDVLIVSIDGQGRIPKAKSLIEEHAWNYPSYIDKGMELFKRFNGEGLPMTLVIDKDGNIVKTHHGYQYGVEYSIQMTLDKLES